jgi:hypothetical protein
VARYGTEHKEATRLRTVADNTIHHGETRPSRLVLPIIER